MFGGNDVKGYEPRDEVPVGDGVPSLIRRITENSFSDGCNKKA